MKGKQRGRPTKWVMASLDEMFWLGKRGITIEVWQKWKRKDRKVGTLTVSVGGLRWRPNKVHAQNYRQRSWRKLDEWFDGEQS